jgi:ferrochelatase
MILVFSAHSLPESDLVDDDPYIAGLRATANSIALKLGLAEGSDAVFPMLKGLKLFGSSEAPRAWFLAYQSKGNRPGEWLGPDLDDIIDAVAGTQVKGLIVVPIGFMTDHMETMYDLDIVAADKAMRADLEWLRVPVPNQHPFIVEAVAKQLSQMV